MNTTVRWRWFIVSMAFLLILGGCKGKKPAEEQTEQESFTSDASTGAAPRPSAKPFGDLTSFEPSIAGLQSGMDTVSVQAILGIPNFVTWLADGRDPRFSLLSWHYRNLTVRFSETDEVGAVEITGPGVATSRGIVVGDSLSKVLAAYGKPARADGILFHFQNSSDVDNGDAVVFRVQDRVVTSVYIGHVYE